MRVFVTGATGFVGSAVVSELIGAGHSVLGLARSDEGAATIEAAGARAVRGSVEDLDSLRRGVAEADGVVHTAFGHDFSRFAESCEADRAAIETMGAALEGSDRPLLVTSGIAMLAPGRLATEADTAEGHQMKMPRRSEAAAMALVERGVRAAVVRLAPSVHGAGDHGFVPILIGIARAKGVSAYVDDGGNRWPGVYRADAARVYRLALERGVVAGARYHAIAEEGVPFREIAAVIGRGLGLPVRSVSGDAVAAHFGFFGMFTGLDMASSSERTREMLGWTPTGPGLIEDVAEAGYFAG